MDFDSLLLTATVPVPQLLTMEGATVAGVLFIAVVFLWKLHVNYTQKLQEEADNTRKELVNNLQKSHEETQGLLKEQNALLSEQLNDVKAQYNDEKALREQEWKDHCERMNEITTGYHLSLKSFEESMKEQTSFLKEIAELPQKVDKIQKSVDENTKSVEELRKNQGGNANKN